MHPTLSPWAYKEIQPNLFFDENQKPEIFFRTNRELFVRLESTFVFVKFHVEKIRIYRRGMRYLSAKHRISRICAASSFCAQCKTQQVMNKESVRGDRRRPLYCKIVNRSTGTATILIRLCDPKGAGERQIRSRQIIAIFNPRKPADA